MIRDTTAARPARPTIMGRQQGLCKVLVSRIPKRVEKQELCSLLSTFGIVHSCETFGDDDDRSLKPEGRRLGQRADCYRVTATFEKPEQAQQAVRNLTRRPFAGGVLRAEYYNAPPTNATINTNRHYNNNNNHNNNHNKTTTSGSNTYAGSNGTTIAGNSGGYANGYAHAYRRNNGVMGGGRAAAAAATGGLSNGRGGGGGGGGVGMSNGLGGLAGGLGPGPFGPYGGPGGHAHAPLGPPPPPPKDIPLRMLVPSEMVGAIIGKSGATIRQITQQSRARVDVHRKDAGGIYNQGQVEKVINIYGSVDNCSSACKKILEVMQQEAANPSEGAGAAAKRSDEPIVLKLLAHNNLVGRVIGRSGSVIKKVMDETSAKINVSSMSDPRERVIIIKGSLDEMSKAQQQITAKMRQCYEYDMQQASAMMAGYGGPPGPLGQAGGHSGPMGHGSAVGHHPHHHHPHHPHHHQGLAGHGGVMGAPPPPPPPPPSYPPPFHRPPLPPPPPPPHHAHHHHAHHGGPGGPGGAGGHGLPHYVPPYGAMGVPAPGGHFFPPGDGSVETVQVWVPSCTVGAIIGTGGSSIREMIRVSGCSIKVSPSSAKEENRSRDEAAAVSSTSSSGKPSKDDSASGSGAAAAAAAGAVATTAAAAEAAGRREGAGGVGIYPHPSDRRVTLTGSAEAQWRAQCALYRKIFYEAIQHLASSPEAANDPQIRAGQLRVEMNVPSNQVGRIIGKGGQTVKELQRLTHALIKLPEESSSSKAGQGSSPEPDGETPVHIIGDFYAVQAAQRQIRALVARNTNTNASQSSTSGGGNSNTTATSSATATTPPTTTTTTTTTTSTAAAASDASTTTASTATAATTTTTTTPTVSSATDTTNATSTATTTTTTATTTANVTNNGNSSSSNDNDNNNTSSNGATSATKKKDDIATPSAAADTSSSPVKLASEAATAAATTTTPESPTKNVASVTVVTDGASETSDVTSNNSKNTSSNDEADNKHKAGGDTSEPAGATATTNNNNNSQKVDGDCDKSESQC